MVGEFVMNNLALVALFVASGVMLLWPEISRFTGMGGQEIGTLEATRLMNQPGTLVLDVREEKEFAEGHLPKARHVPLKELGNRVGELAKFKSKPVIVTCRTGARAGAACRALKAQGFTTVFQLKGGLAEWRKASLPVEK
jgi:rhodanese-related sulfurtransferase